MNFSGTYKQLQSDGYKACFRLGLFDVFKRGRSFAVCDRDSLKLHRGVSLTQLQQILPWVDFSLRELDWVHIGEQLADDLGSESAIGFLHPYRENEVLVQLGTEWVILNQHGNLLSYESLEEALTQFNSLSYHYFWADNHEASLPSHWFVSDELNLDQVNKFRLLKIANPLGNQPSLVA